MLVSTAGLTATKVRSSDGACHVIMTGADSQTNR